MTRGGKRAGAGRPSLGFPTTKITVYRETHELINKYAKEANLPVVELMYRVANHEDFDVLVKKVNKDKQNSF